MNSKRIEELMKQTAYPESASVYSAMFQVWNEMVQDYNTSRICENCAWVGGNHAVGDGIYTALYCSNSNIEVGIVRKDFGCNKFERKELIDEKTNT